eukprot:m.82805 g.82805  ORF g.82805 m.82805 type:complete len:167 (+) comp12102_c0_seq4:545-1045(+)
MELYMKLEYYEMKSAEKKQKHEEKKQKHSENRTKMERETMAATIEKGCVLQFTGASEECSREDLKAAFEEFGDIAWVDFSRGEPSGHIRFRQSGCAEKAAAAFAESKKEVVGNVLELKVLEGEDELDYWIATERERAAARNKKRDFSKRRGGRGRQFRNKKAKRND